MVASFSMLAVAPLRRRRLRRVAALMSIISNEIYKHDFSKKKRRWWVRPIFKDHDTHGAWNSLIPCMREEDPEEYYNFFRMWPEHFDELLERVSPFISKKSWRKSIPAGERLAITLRKFASGVCNMSLQYLFRVSNQAISNIVFETSHVLWRVLSLDEDIFEPLSEDLWLRVASEYEAMWNFPNCLGAIDGVHIFAKAFAHTGTLFYCYKKRFSINVMAVADAKQKFLIVEAGSCGSSGDAGVFLRSTLYKKLMSRRLNLPPAIPVNGIEGEIPFMFVGDNAYGCSDHLQTPFKGKFLPPEETIFNYRLSRARRSVEAAFGILEKRFPVLHGTIEGSYENVKAMTLACFALHNFHLTREESLPPGRRNHRLSGSVQYELRDGTIVPGRWLAENRERAASVLQHLKAAVCDHKGEAHEFDGFEVREKLLEYFIDHDVPWQWKLL